MTQQKRPLFVSLALVLTVAVAPLSPPANAQSSGAGGGPAPVGQSATGLVTARGRSQPVGGAEVIDLGNRESTATTGPDGRFTLPLVPQSPGILIRAEGFEDLEVKTNDGQLPPGPYALDPSAQVVGRGIIRARRKAEVSQSSLSRQELQRVAGTGGDAIQALQTLPGVLPVGFGANIVVRGGAPGDNSFYYDRLEIPFVFHLGGLSTVVPTRMLAAVDLYPGGFSSPYSNAIGSIVQLRSEPAVPAAPSGQFDLSLLQAGAYYEDATEGGIGYRLGVRRSYLELFKPLIKKLSGDNTSLVTLPQFTDYQMVLNGRFEGGAWQAHLLGAANRLKLVTENGLSSDDDGKITFSLFNYFQTSGFQITQSHGPTWGSLIGFQQRYVLIDQKFFKNIVNVRAHRFSFPLQVENRFTDTFTLALGARPEVERTTTDVDALQIPPGGPGPLFDPDTAPRSVEKNEYTDIYGSVYLDAIYKPHEDWLINPGTSYFVGPRPQQQSLDPRLLVRWRVWENHTLKGAVGQYSQRPEPAFDSKKFGNPQLKLEKAIHYVAGVETKWTPLWESDLQFYYKDMFDLVGADVENPKKKYANNIKGRAYGAEVLVRKAREGSWNGWVSYGYGVSKRRDPKNKAWLLSNFDRPHSLNIVGSYRATGRWELSSRIQWVSGDTVTNIPGGRFNANTGRYRPLSDPSYSLQRNDGREPAFFKWDVRSDYDVLFDTWKFTWYIDVENVTNRKNVQGSRYSPDYRKREYVTGLGILPNLGVQASF